MSTTGAVSKKARVSTKPATHPPFKTMIESAIVALSAGRKKASRQAINKHIFVSNLTVEDNSPNRKHINRALARMATSGAIIRKSGTGASGSFCPVPKPVKPASEKKKKKKVVKKVVKKVSAGTPKKKTSTKKTVGVLKAKSPGKKTIKTVTKKRTKAVTKKTIKPKSPVKKSGVRKTVSVKKGAGMAKNSKAVTKKPAMKKAPAKK